MKYGYKPAETATDPSQVTQKNVKPECSFYVGGNARKLPEAFGEFQAFECVETAIHHLTRSFPAISIPEYFILDGALSEADLRIFHQFINSATRLSAVPVIVYSSALKQSELAKFQKFSFIDEVIFTEDISREKLASKINFLRKIKIHAAQQPLKPHHSTSNSVVFPSRLLKRTFDVVFSIVALMLLSPLFIIISVLIKLESYGPVFYVSKRAGRGYKIFNFYKFRTMVKDADEKLLQVAHLNMYASGSEGPGFYKFNNDPRITKTGTFLRNSSLDELPQLINVLLGDMSLVGNRPLPLYEAVTLTTDDWAARFMAPAGITGLWQIKKRGDKNMSTEERINLDIAYAEKYNFMYDLWIMANTPSALFQKENV